MGYLHVYVYESFYLVNQSDTTNNIGSLYDELLD